MHTFIYNFDKQLPMDNAKIYDLNYVDLVSD